MGCGSNNEPTVPPESYKSPKCTSAVTQKLDIEIHHRGSEDNFKLAQEELFSPKKVYITPTRALKLNEWPYFSDDLDFENMILAIDRQLKRYSQIDLASRTIEFGGKAYSGLVFRESLKEFKNLVNTYWSCKAKMAESLCLEQFNQSLRQKFNVFVPDLKPGDTRYGESQPVLFTAYYTPTLNASLTPTSTYPHAIYKKPTGSLVSSTRHEIDFKNKLGGRGLELFYAENLFDLYLLHVQGGGKVVLNSGSGKQKYYYLTYDGTNGQSWNFISKYMTEKGYIANGSIEDQRIFLNAHPEKQEEIFATCPSYVYFKVSNEPPLGSDLVPLTDNRSIATDTNHYLFKGALAFVEAKRPANPYDPKESCKPGDYRSFSRFYLDQDTGGAIKGKGRVDLYFGEDRYAEIAAYNTVQRGNLYFLLLK